MDELRGVRSCQGRSDLQGDGQRLGEGKRAGGDAIAQRLTLEQLHHGVRKAVHLADVVDGDDVGMRQCGNGVSLRRKPVECVAIDVRNRHHLDGDVALQPGIGRAIDLAHRASAEQRAHQVGTQLIAGLKLHRSVDRVSQVSHISCVS
jgi:hypothetical protein